MKQTIHLLTIILIFSMLNSCQSQITNDYQYIVFEDGITLDCIVYYRKDFKDEHQTSTINKKIIIDNKMYFKICNRWFLSENSDTISDNIELNLKNKTTIDEINQLLKNASFDVLNKRRIKLVEVLPDKKKIHTVQILERFSY